MKTGGVGLLRVRCPSPPYGGAFSRFFESNERGLRGGVRRTPPEGSPKTPLGVINRDIPRLIYPPLSRVSQDLKGGTPVGPRFPTTPGNQPGHSPVDYPPPRPGCPPLGQGGGKTRLGCIEYPHETRLFS